MAEIDEKDAQAFTELQNKLIELSDKQKFVSFRTCCCYGLCSLKPRPISVVAVQDSAAASTCQSDVEEGRADGHRITKARRRYSHL